MIEHKHQRGRLRFLRCSVRPCVILLTALCVLAAMSAPLFRPDADSRRRAANDQLLTAAKKGDLTALAKAIYAGADIPAWDANGDTAISFAFKAKNLALVQLLVQEGASLDTAFGSGTAHATPLAFAVGKGDVQLTRFLLDAGANLNSKRHSQSLLHKCIENADFEMMDLLLERGADTEIFVDGNLGSALHAAIQSSRPPEIRYAMMEKLLQHEADLPAVVHGCNAMDLAVRHNDAGACDLLRRHGASYTVREAAVFNRLTDVQRMVAESPHLLTEHFSVGYYVKPGEGATLLGIAIERGHEELVTWLLSAGAAGNSIELYGGTPLHMAVRGGHPQLVKLLLDRKADVDARSESRHTPLLDAVSEGRENVVALLLDAGADENARDDLGRTPLHMAARQGRLQLVQRLLAAGADPTLTESLHGATPYELAGRGGHLEVQEALELSEPDVNGAGNEAETRRC